MGEVVPGDRDRYCITPQPPRALPRCGHLGPGCRASLETWSPWPSPAQPSASSGPATPRQAPPLRHWANHGLPPPPASPPRPPPGRRTACAAAGTGPPAPGGPSPRPGRQTPRRQLPPGLRGPGSAVARTGAAQQGSLMRARRRRRR